MEDLLTQTNYAIDTFYFLVMGVLVMFMACGFSMLEAGMIRAKNTSEILTKNVALYSISCIMYLLFGYYIMYMNNADGGWLPSFGWLIGVENTTEEIVAGTAGGVATDHIRTFGLLLPGGVRRDGHVHRVRRRRRAHEALGLPDLRPRHDRIDLSRAGHVDLGRRLAKRCRLFGLRRFGHRPHVRGRRSARRGHPAWAAGR